MTTQQARAYAALMTAIADGEDVEYHDELTKRWVKVVGNKIDLSIPPEHYRISRKPIVVFAAVGKRAIFGYYGTPSEAANRLVKAKCADGRVVKMIEAGDVPIGVPAAPARAVTPAKTTKAPGASAEQLAKARAARDSQSQNDVFTFANAVPQAAW